MALKAAISSTTPNIDSTQNYFHVFGTIAVSGNYGTVSSNGDTLDLSQLGIPSQQPPKRVSIWEEAVPGVSQSGWEYKFNPGTKANNGSMQVFNGTTQLAENTAYASATPAVPATLYYEAWFASFV